MQLNEPGKQKIQTLSSWQCRKHASYGLTDKKNLFSSRISAEGTLISASTKPHYGTHFSLENSLVPCPVYKASAVLSNIYLHMGAFPLHGYLFTFTAFLVSTR